MTTLYHMDSDKCTRKLLRTCNNSLVEHDVPVPRRRQCDAVADHHGALGRGKQTGGARTAGHVCLVEGKVSDVASHLRRDLQRERESRREGGRERDREGEGGEKRESEGV